MRGILVCYKKTADNLCRPSLDTSISSQETFLVARDRDLSYTTRIWALTFGSACRLEYMGSGNESTHLPSPPLITKVGLYRLSMSFVSCEQTGLGGLAPAIE